MDHTVGTACELVLLSLHSVIEVVNVAHAVGDYQIVLFLKLDHLRDRGLSERVMKCEKIERFWDQSVRESK